MAGSGPDSMEDLWRKARLQLSEYELQLAELKLEVEREHHACLATKETIAMLVKDTHKMRAAKVQLDTACDQERLKHQDLLLSCEATRKDSQGLIQQLNLLKQKLQTVNAASQSKRQARTKDVQELSDYAAKITEGTSAAARDIAPAP